jgi:hypothetical protein
VDTHLRRDLPDRTLTWNERHLLHALREFESSCNAHRPHRAPGQAAPLRSLPVPIAGPDQMTNPDIRKRDRPSGVLHEYQHAA